MTLLQLVTLFGNCLLLRNIIVHRVRGMKMAFLWALLSACTLFPMLRLSALSDAGRVSVDTYNLWWHRKDMLQTELEILTFGFLLLAMLTTRTGTPRQQTLRLASESAAFVVIGVHLCLKVGEYWSNYPEAFGLMHLLLGVRQKVNIAAIYLLALVAYSRRSAFSALEGEGNANTGGVSQETRGDGAVQRGADRSGLDCGWVWFIADAG